ncbi:MAG TPA: T9SS type A sorting domain-containing protein [Ferruginibacter sp.]|nr:T9SS type A sorting domain-containing protein [Ferruginibacter sp.]HMP19807.1 T9SS type A sorting domain-containing protein [Ferruginibacter sp.]
MVFVRYCLLTAAGLCCMLQSNSQTVYYPAQASSLLKATAADMAMLLQKAVQGSSFSTQAYSVMARPQSGIVLLYDSTLSTGQHCMVKSDGAGIISFAAAEDNGLHYGVYQYLKKLGFIFYLPGNIWEHIPALSSAFVQIDTTYQSSYKYNTWFISGGHNRWVMDNDNSYYWDTYFGKNGHQWALYQRRNGTTGAYRYNGHRGDMMSGAYLETLKNNPCYVAPYNGSREATVQSVPDIRNISAMQQWQLAIEQAYTKTKNTILGNKTLYPNLANNFSYNHANIGIEVPDGAHWANSNDNSGCTTGNLLSESDQHFTLANYTAQKINLTYPGIRFQAYAYDGHANTPSENITINPNIDIQVVPTAFQQELSPVGLMSRWYRRYANISEYHYLNLPQWSGETPAFFLEDMKATLQRIKNHKSQGIVWEISPAKFASLPYLFAFNTALTEGKTIDNTLQEFCNNLFGKAASTIFTLLQHWSDDKTVMLNHGIQDNKYKLPLYFELLQQATQQAATEPALVQARLLELKAYLHYMQLYYNWAFDQEPAAQKADKAAALCIYLARIHDLQIVNSYFLIVDLVNRNKNVPGFYELYNTTNGKAYLGGSLPKLTAREIDDNFSADIAQQKNLVQQYRFEDVHTIKKHFAENNLQPLDSIKIFINYTHAKDYAAKAEFYILAEKPGSFTIQYSPYFNMPGKGYINFTTEKTGESGYVTTDYSINHTASKGLLQCTIPEAGLYKLTVSSKYQSAMDLVIGTSGNYFLKNGPFAGNTTENYRKQIESLPGYFYIPEGVSKVFFSLNNSNPGGAAFASPTAINNAFAFKDNLGNTVVAKLVSSADSALFYLEIPTGSSGSFWRYSKMEQYRLTFANISNIHWYASPMPCSPASFSITLTQSNAGCIIKLKADASVSTPYWKITGPQGTQYFQQTAPLELPADAAPTTTITLYGNAVCPVTKILKNEAEYLQQLQLCTSAAPTSPNLQPVLYPNPGKGLYNCMLSGQAVTAGEITIYNTSGGAVARFANTSQFNISHLPGGMYFYQLVIKGAPHRGRLVKQ